VNLKQFHRILRLVVIVPVVALLLMATALVWQMKSAHDTVRLIQASGDDIAQTILIQKLIVDEEAGLRGYQITGDASFLIPYTAAQPQIDEKLKALEATAVGGPIATANRLRLIEEVRSAQAAWQQGFAVPLIATIAAGGHTEDVDLNRQGRRQMDGIRDALGRVVQATEQRRDARAGRWHIEARRLFLEVGFFALVVGLVLGLFMRGLLHRVTDAYSQTLGVLKLRADDAFRSEERLRTTLASIGDGVITCGIDGHIETMNRVAEELTGWTEVDAQKLPLREVLHLVQATTREAVEDPFDRVRRLGRVTKLASDTALIRRDGSEILIDDSGAPIREQSGEPIGFVLVFRDVTLARKSQAALIANEKLAVSGRLAASIAHEIHNPLDSVSNLLFLMDGVTSPEEATHFLGLAKQEIARVTQISRAMLGLYRESRSPMEINLGEMLESVMLLMERRFAELGIAVSVGLPKDAMIHGFPAELRQVFTNLLANAAEAAGENGSVTMTAVVSSRPDEGGRPEAGYEITVADSGPGIPEEVRARLFQPFFTTKGERGTGLGLWVSRGIITRHGGEISIDSLEGHGTKAHVFLATDPVIQPATVSN
jgi:PAS domain S-box-containing protein